MLATCCCNCLISGYYQITPPDMLPVEADFTIQSGSATWGTPGGVPSWTLNADGTIVTLNRTSPGKQAFKFTVESPNWGETLGLILGWQDSANYLIAEMELGVCYRILQRAAGVETLLCEALAGSGGNPSTKTGGFIACYDPDTHLFRLSAVEQKLIFTSNNVHVEATVPTPSAVGSYPGFYRRSAAANPVFHFNRFTQYRDVAASSYSTNECPACGQTCAISHGPNENAPDPTPSQWADVSGAWVADNAGLKLVGNGRVILKRESRNEIHSYSLTYSQYGGLQRDARLRVMCNVVDDQNYHFVEGNCYAPLIGNPATGIEFGRMIGGVKTILATDPQGYFSGTAAVGQSEQMLHWFGGYGVFQEPLAGGKRVGFEVLNSTVGMQVSWGTMKENIPLEPADAADFKGIGGECYRPLFFPSCSFFSEEVAISINGFVTGGLPHLNGTWIVPWYFSHWRTPVMNFPAPWTDPSFDPILPKFVDRFQIYGTWYATWYNHLGIAYTGPQIVVRIFEQAPSSRSYEVIRWMGSLSMAGLNMHCENFTTVDADWPTLVREPGAYVGGIPFNGAWPAENPTINMDSI